MKNKKGFTLIEIIVVLIILGVLASLGISSYYAWVVKCRAAEAYITMGEYIKEAQACFMTSQAAACAATPMASDNFIYSPIDYTGTSGLTSCVAIIAQSRNSTSSPITITCRCKNVDKFIMTTHSYLGKTIDLETGVVTDCTTNGGVFQGM